MDQKRLFLAIAISVAILLGFQFLMPHPAVPPPSQTASQSTPAKPGSGEPGAAGPAKPTVAANTVPKTAPRVQIDAPSVGGSISLLGARIDDLVLKDYRETLAPDSPLVRLLEPRSEAEPYYAQYGWTAPAGVSVKLPGDDTVWSASAPELAVGKPVTLSWDNGAGLTFEIVLSIDENYMFSVDQRVKNASGEPVSLFPWARIRRDYTPQVAGYYVLFEGLLGVVDGTLQETTYAKTKSDGDKKGGIAYDATAAGGWAGMTDKYWLTALVPDQAVASTMNFRHIEADGDHYQVDYVTRDPQSIAVGATASLPSHLFAGAKVVRLLDHYESEYKIPSFDKAVDFGWFYFLTKPMFYALDFLNGLLGNFGLAIMAFTICVKALFFPLANYSYRSMSKMKLLGPKMTALRERFKDEPQRMQQEMMAMYKAEKVNPASGCLPMVVQIPVFFSLYKDIFVTIEMRHAPFFGWIHDLSSVDPTNVFNLFGLIPFDPTTLPGIGSFLHLGAWPLIMGCTMFLQQQLNPPPPDPVQARLFQFMPIIFTFMLAKFPAGLVIYWSWNNLLSVAQQWLIMKRTHLARPGLART
ncbi:MAG TPA: membrane protein insertase YidC [Acetobacteraceae bacterium]|jgi:YidC/Oxa1 family membrane protein insertase|nr:membrane protein insertase YidC [Acetobacteraceae bacterium]